MPTKPDDQRRIDLLRAELLDLGLDWNIHYRLINEGAWWALDFPQNTTPDQNNRALELLAMIMNR